MRNWYRVVLAVASMVLLATCQPAAPPSATEPVRGGVAGCEPVRPDGADPAAATAAGTRGTRPDDIVRVDLGRELGPVDPDLTGMVWNTGDSLEALAPVHPSIVRIDGSLQDRSPAPGQLDLQPLLDRVAEVRAIGAEPLVLLSYMPRWLGQPRAGTDDATRYGPYDLDLWEALITDVVRGLATAPEPAYRFEVWNEPDIFIFWLDTPEYFVETALRTHRAVARVAQETGLPLEIGGPASAFGLNENMVEYLRRVVEADLPLDFVSWHNYANSPFLGPDGAEGNLDEDIYLALAKRNPDATPLRYSAEIEEIRAEVDAVVAGSDESPELVIDEWNVSAGGYDFRHDRAEGAALVAGALIEMERAGLDSAAFYRSTSGDSNRVGDWGLVYSDGTPKPSWWVFRAWWTMTGARLRTEGDDGSTGLWARATRDRGCVSVLLTNFVATGAPARTVEVTFDGRLPHCRGKRTATVATLDTTSPTLVHAHAVRLRGKRRVTVPMEPQSVALLRIACSG